MLSIQRFLFRRSIPIKNWNHFQSYFECDCVEEIDLDGTISLYLVSGRIPWNRRWCAFKLNSIAQMRLCTLLRHHFIQLLHGYYDTSAKKYRFESNKHGTFASIYLSTDSHRHKIEWAKNWMVTMRHIWHHPIPLHPFIKSIRILRMLIYDCCVYIRSDDQITHRSLAYIFSFFYDSIGDDAITTRYPKNVCFFNFAFIRFYNF